MAVGNGASRVTMKESKMKTLRCPLCGGSFELFEEGANIYLYQCLDCPLASSVSYTEKGALENAKELISKFPPIMRVWPEDTVVWKNKPVVVLDKDVQEGELVVINWQGRKFLLPHHAIEKWPWELKQQEQP